MPSYYILKKVGDGKTFESRIRPDFVLDHPDVQYTVLAQGRGDVALVEIEDGTPVDALAKFHDACTKDPETYVFPDDMTKLLSRIR